MPQRVRMKCDKLFSKGWHTNIIIIVVAINYIVPALEKLGREEGKCK